jgi:hypothetical protein
VCWLARSVGDRIDADLGLCLPESLAPVLPDGLGCGEAVPNVALRLRVLTRPDLIAWLRLITPCIQGMSPLLLHSPLPLPMLPLIAPPLLPITLLHPSPPFSCHSTHTTAFTMPAIATCGPHMLRTSTHVQQIPLMTGRCAHDRACAAPPPLPISAQSCPTPTRIPQARSTTTVNPPNTRNPMTLNGTARQVLYNSQTITVVMRRMRNPVPTLLARTPFGRGNRKPKRPWQQRG